MKAKPKKLHYVKIRSCKDLPSWFDLGKYRELRHMDIADWFLQFAVRAAASDSASSWRLDTSEYKEHNMSWDFDPRQKRRMVDLPKNDSSATVLLTQIEQSPILTSARLAELDRPTCGMLIKYFELIDPLSPLSSMGVHPSTVEEVYLNEQSLRANQREIARTFFNEGYDVIDGWQEEDQPNLVAGQRIVRFLNRKARHVQGPMPGLADLFLGRTGGSPYTPWLSAPIRGHQVAPYPLQSTLLTIDMRLPDSLLLKQFSACLDALRSGFGVPPPKRLNRTQFSHWIRQGILPYLDLKLWSCLEEAEISNRVIADSIFRSPGSEENVRKTTAPLAKQLTSTSSPLFLQLKAQAAQALAVKTGNSSTPKFRNSK
jgi:hypothetical protein